MGNLTVAVLGSAGYAECLGKKGTCTDITLYDLKKGEDTVTFIEPTRYPERLAPLFYAASLGKKAIVVADEINAQFGEALVMLQCTGITSGYIVVRNYLPVEKIEQLIKGTSLENYEITKDDPAYLREQLLKEAQQKTPVAATPGIVPVDHSFNVKGVGTVILGVVAKGKIQKHETLNALPTTKTAQIRSIQKHDDEFDQASEGDRVGLALKNVDVEDVERGTVLTSDPSVKITKSLQTQASLVKYWQTPIKPGMVMHIGHWTQFVTAKVEEVHEENDWRKPTLTFTLEKALVHNLNDKAVLMYLDGAKLRVAGTVNLQ